MIDHIPLVSILGFYSCHQSATEGQSYTRTDNSVNDNADQDGIMLRFSCLKAVSIRVVISSMALTVNPVKGLDPHGAQARTDNIVDAEFDDWHG